MSTAVKKRIRYKIPTYKKVDKIKQNILDYKCNQKHIFRYKALYNVLKEIADYLLIAYEITPNSDVLSYLFKRTHLIIYRQGDGYYTEFFETCNQPIEKRLKIHISLLRCLQKGYEIEQAVNYTRQQHNLALLNNLKL